MSKTFTLHGFAFDTPEERQKVAEEHHLWSDYLTYSKKHFHDSNPNMSDTLDRERFELFIEGARRESERPPADWYNDSSLETWFPMAAEQLKNTEAENTKLKREIQTLHKTIDELNQAAIDAEFGA